jgi:hypothetical protein
MVDSAGRVVWSGLETLAFPVADPETDQPARKRPWAVADNVEPTGLWLFWLEMLDMVWGPRWQLRYNRHNGTTWAQEEPITLPPDVGDTDPRVQDDVFATFHATDQSLWLFWSRRMPTGTPEQTRWQIAYRVKSTLTVDDSGWSEVRTLPAASLDEETREPYALVRADGNLDILPMRWS